MHVGNKGAVFDILVVNRTERCICFFSMADKIRMTSLVLGLFLPTKSKEKNNTWLNIWCSNQATEATGIYLNIKWSAGQIIDLCQLAKALDDMLNQLGIEMTRTENTDSAKHQKDKSIPEGGCYGWAYVSCSPTALKQGGQWTPC